MTKIEPVETNVLRALRHLRGLSPQEISTRTDVSVHIFKRIESKTKPVDSKLLKKIVKALELRKKHVKALKAWLANKPVDPLFLLDIDDFDEGREANVLRGLRGGLGLSQANAAETMGVSRSLWAAWETDLRSLHVSKLSEIRSKIELNESDFRQLVLWRAWTRFASEFKTQSCPHCSKDVGASTILREDSDLAMRVASIVWSGVPMSAEQIDSMREALQLSDEQASELLSWFFSSDSEPSKMTCSSCEEALFFSAEPQ